VNNVLNKLWTTGNFIGLKTRPARALIGWMAERDAQILLGIPQSPVKPRPEHVQRVRDAHVAVMSRAIGIDQTDALSDMGEDLRAYVAEFQEHPNGKQYLVRGWIIRVANLNKICALQPIVHLDYLGGSDQFKKLLQQAVEEDMRSLAQITLPISSPVELPVQFDPQQNAWILHSPSPDTRIVGHFSLPMEVAPGVFGRGYGFCVAVLPSFVQVVRYRGRYFLKDGYHRCIALLEKGITHIPVLYQEILETQPLKVEGRFPDETILGVHPPQLPDYLRDDVAAAVSHLAFQKTITIRSTENQSWGDEF